MRTLLAVVLLAFAQIAGAAISAYTFDTPQQEARFKKLSEELRCLVCQNENHEDSNAPLARDLRRDIHDMIVAGRTDKQIIGFMTDRYGDFVLYRPPLQHDTVLLWTGPFLFLLIGLVWLLVVIRTRVSVTGEAPLDEAEQQRLETLTHAGEEKKS